MEKIKSLLSPGKGHDDETVHGTGEHPVAKTGQLAGEGSHFGSSKDTNSPSQPPGAINPTGAVHGSSSTSGVSGTGYPLNSGVPASQTASNSQASEFDKRTGTAATSDISRPAGSGITGSNTHYTGAGTSHSTQHIGSEDFGANSGSIGADRSSTLGAGVAGSGLRHGESPHDRSIADSGAGGTSTGYQGVGSQGSYYTGPSGTAVVDNRQHNTANPNDTFPDSNRQVNPESSHHYARQGDGAESAESRYARTGAFAGAGAAVGGLAAHEHHNTQSETGHDNTTFTGQPAAGGLGGTSSDRDPIAGTEQPTAGYTSMPGAFPAGTPIPGPNTSNIYESDPRIQAHANTAPGIASGPESETKPAPISKAAYESPSQTTSQHDSHQHREFPLVGGAAGASTVVAAHQVGKHSTSQHAEDSREAATTSRGIPDRTTGDPQSLNKGHNADAKVDTIFSKTSHGDAVPGGTAIGGAKAHGLQPAQGVTTGTTSHTTTSDHSSQDANRSQDHHYGRDATLVGGTAGAIGTTHEAQRQAVTTEPYSSGTSRQYDSRTDDDRSSKDKDHHYGRDAAVVGGAAYAADSHHDNKNEKQLEKEHKQELKDEKKAHNEAEKDHKAAEKHAEKDHKHAVKEAEKDHKHAEKEAQKAAEKDHKAAEKQSEKDHKLAVKAAEKDHKAAEKQAEKDQKHAEKEAKKEQKGGFLSFLHRDKSKKYTQEEEAEFDRQEQEHDKSHSGRDAALGGAAVGGAGAYAAHKHASQSTAGTDSHHSPLAESDNRRVDAGARNDNTFASDNNASRASTRTDESRRDPDLSQKAAFGGGSAGLAAHEYSGDHNTTSQRTGGVGLGTQSSEVRDRDDKTSGLQRSHQQDQTHPGRNAAALGGAAGVGALASDQYQKHQKTTERQSDLTGSVNSTYDNPSSLTGSHQHENRHTSPITSEHPNLVGQYGSSDTRALRQPGNIGQESGNQRQDAQLLGGAAAGTGIGTSTEDDYDPFKSGTTTADKEAGLTEPGHHNVQHYSAHDTTGHGGSGLKSENDYRTPGTTSGLTESRHHPESSGLTGSPHATSVPTETVPSNGRNRLHKDPPASHPAANLPTSGGS